MKSKDNVDNAIVIAMHETDALLQRLFFTYKGCNTFLIVTVKNLLDGSDVQLPPIENLVELNRDDTLTWLKKYVPYSIDAYNDLYTKSKEDVTNSPIQIRMGTVLRGNVESVCEAFDLTVNSVVCGIIRRHLEEYRNSLRGIKKSTHLSYLSKSN